MTEPFMLTVPGDAIPQGSKTVATSKNGRSYVRDDNPKLKPWREKITAAAKFEISDRYHGKWEPLDGPLVVDVLFYLARNKGHYGSGRNSDRLLPSAPAYPTAFGGGDVDKLARACLDSLKDASVIVDDARVVHLTAWKLFAELPNRPRMCVIVKHLVPAAPAVETVLVQGALL